MTAGSIDIETVVERDGTARFRVRGEVDIATIPQLIEAVEASIPPGGVVEIDLCDVAFIDSAGVAGLNRCRRSALAAGAGLRIVAGEESPVTRLLAWTGLDRLLDVVRP